MNVTSIFRPSNRDVLELELEFKNNLQATMIIKKNADRHEVSACRKALRKAAFPRRISTHLSVMEKEDYDIMWGLIEDFTEEEILASRNKLAKIMEDLNADVQKNH